MTGAGVGSLQCIPFIPLHFCTCEYTAHSKAKLLQRKAAVLGQVSQETDSNMGICLRKFPVGCFWQHY